MKSSTITREQLAAMFDHTNLKAFATESDFKKFCEEAKSMGCAMVAVNPYPVRMCREFLKGSGVHVGAAISFPLGQNTIEEKADETRRAIEDGADEIDYVLNVGKLKEGDLAYIRREMETIVSICREKGVLSKVIFENCYLTADEIRSAAQIAREVRPDYIKTSTGFGTSGAREEDVRLMKETVGDAVKVKAAGGIRDWKTCAAMIDAGAERIGTSSSRAILAGFDRAAKKKWTDGIMGVLIGDALGNPVQFMSREKVKMRGPVKGMEAGGVFHMPAGCWTDDGSMTLASMDSILEMGYVDPEDLMDRFILWDQEGKYTPTGRAYDQGITCMDALDRYRRGKKWDACGRTGEKANGNGALMRILPICLYAADRQEKAGMTDREAMILVHCATFLTHNHLRACMAGGLYYFMVREILRQEGGTLTEILQRGLDQGMACYEEEDLDSERIHFSRIMDLDALSRAGEDQIRSSGYVIHTLEAALWSLVTTDSLEEALLKVVNLGEDADTTGAVAGGLAGLYYGYSAVPEAWKAAMKKREELEAFCRRADQYTFT